MINSNQVRQKLGKISEKVTDIRLYLDEELAPAIRGAMDAIQERADNRESGEMTDAEQERYDDLDDLLYVISDIEESLDLVAEDAENA